MFQLTEPEAQNLRSKIAISVGAAATRVRLREGP